MRLLVTTAFALFASIPAGGIVAVLLAEWARADEVYIFVFMGIAPAALLANAVFLYAAARGSIDAAFRVMLIVIAAGCMLLSAFEYFGAPNAQLSLRGLKLMAVIAITVAVMVSVQWLIFRTRERRRPV
jgi:hypothetical protein